MPTWEIDDHRTIELEGEVDEVRVRLLAGDVAVTAAEGPATVDVERLHGRSVQVSFEDGVLRIGYERDRDGWDTWDRLTSIGRDEAAVAVTVPASVTADVNALSARLAVRGIQGRVHAKSLSGDVVLDDLQGDVDVNTASGDVDARGLTGRLRSSTVSGELTLASGRCPTLEARAVSGDRTLDLTLDRSGRYDVGTVSGDVAVRVDADDPDLEVSVSTMSGRIDSTFPLHKERGPIGRRLWGRIGEGSADMRVKTLSGRVTLLGPGR